MEGGGKFAVWGKSIHLISLTLAGEQIPDECLQLGAGNPTPPNIFMHHKCRNAPHVQTSSRMFSIIAPIK